MPLSAAAVPLSLLPAGTPLKDFARLDVASTPARPRWESTVLLPGGAAGPLLELSAIAPASSASCGRRPADPKRRGAHEAAAPGESPAKAFRRLKARAAAAWGVPGAGGGAHKAEPCLLISPAALRPKREEQAAAGEQGRWPRRDEEAAALLLAPPAEKRALGPVAVKRDHSSVARDPLVLESPQKIFLRIKQKLQEKPLLERGDASRFHAGPNAPPSPAAKQPLLLPEQLNDLNKKDPSPAASQDNEFLVEPAELDNETFNMAVSVADISYDPAHLADPLGGPLLEERGLHQKGKPTLGSAFQKLPQAFCDIIFATPKVRIPRKQKPAGGVSEEPQIIPGADARSDESREGPQVIYLSGWRIKVINSNTAVCLEGKRRDMKNIYWHSNAIVERMALNKIKTLSGNVYVLEGHIDAESMKKEGIPSKFIKRFGFGIPRNWKKYVDDLLHILRRKEQRNAPSSEDSNKQDDSLEAKNLEEQQDLPKNLRRNLDKRNATYEVLTQANNKHGTQNDHNMSLTRSGRRVKPPMHFWCGERLLVDQALNVTVTKGGRNYLSPTVSSVQPPGRQSLSSKKDKEAPDARVGREVLPSWTKDSKESDDEIATDDVWKRQAIVALAPLNHKKPCEENLKYSKRYKREEHVSKRGRKRGGYGTRLGREPPAFKYPLRSRKQVSQSDQLAKICQGSSEDESSEDIPSIKRKAQSSFTRELFSGERRCARRWWPELRATENASDPSVPKSKASPALVAEDSNDSRSSTSLVSSSPGLERRNQRKSLRRLQSVPKYTFESESESETQMEEFQLAKGGQKTSVKRTNGRISTVEAGKTPAVGNVKDSVPDIHEAWTDEELHLLRRAVTTLPKHKSGFWLDVAKMVGTRSAEECQQQYMADQEGRRWRTQKTTRPRRKKRREEGLKQPVAVDAKVGTLKRKQQMRHFLEQMAKDNHDDVFTATPFQSRSTKLPQFRAVPEEDVFQLKDSHPITPSSAIFPLVKTPQCDHVSPGMLGSLDREDCEKHVFHAQKNMRGKERTWQNVKKKPAQTVFGTPISRRAPPQAFEAAVPSPGVGELFQGNPRNHQGEEEEEEEEDAYFSS